MHGCRYNFFNQAHLAAITWKKYVKFDIVDIYIYFHKKEQKRETMAI